MVLDPKTTMNFKKREGYTRRDVFFVPLSDIGIVPGSNPRTVDLENDQELREYIDELAESIQTNGQTDSMLVRKNSSNPKKPLLLVDGECRYWALKSLQERGVDIKAKVEVTTESDPLQLLLLAATRNLQRKSMRFADEASLVQRLHKYGFSDDEISSSLSKSITWVRARQEISGAVEAVRQACQNKKISQKTARDISKNVPAEKQEAVLSEILEAGEGKRHLATRAGEDVLNKVTGKKRTIRPTKKKISTVLTKIKDTDVRGSFLPAESVRDLLLKALEFAAGAVAEDDFLNTVYSEVLQNSKNHPPSAPRPQENTVKVVKRTLNSAGSNKDNNPSIEEALTALFGDI